jgi:hypothetical protein
MGPLTTRRGNHGIRKASYARPPRWPCYGGWRGQGKCRLAIYEPAGGGQTRMRLAVNNLRPGGMWTARSWINDWPSQIWLTADYSITLERTQMKATCISLLVLALAAAGCSRSSSDTQAPAEAKSPAGAINFINTDLQHVLGFYGKLAGAELVVGPGVQLPPALITLSNQQPVTRTEALSLIEGALRDRAGLAIEYQDAKHFTVKPAK